MFEDRWKSWETSIVCGSLVPYPVKCNDCPHWNKSVTGLFHVRVCCNDCPQWNSGVTGLFCFRVCCEALCLDLQTWYQGLMPARDVLASTEFAWVSKWPGACISWEQAVSSVHNLYFILSETSKRGCDPDAIRSNNLFFADRFYLTYNNIMECLLIFM